MWIRITCPNGHALEHHQMRRAARTGTCPNCHASVSMWIKVACPNGHLLKVQTKFAGRVGKCPQCSLGVPIPLLGEEQIFELLDGVAAQNAALPVHQDTKHHAANTLHGDSGDTLGSTVLRKAPKTCPRCHKQCSPKYTICPHCRTFLPFSDPLEVDEVLGHHRHAAIHCPGCQATSFPGATVCTNCGMSLVEPA